MDTVEFVPSGLDPNVGMLVPRDAHVKRIRMTRNESDKLPRLYHQNLLTLVHVDDSFVYYGLPRNIVNFRDWDPVARNELIVSRPCFWRGIYSTTHNFLSERFRKMLKALIIFMNDLHTENVCTKQCWREDAIMVEFDQPKLNVPVGWIVGENEKYEDFRQLANWIKSVTLDDIPEMNHFVAALSSSGCVDLLGVLKKHPVLMGHIERVDFIFSLGRDLTQIAAYAGENNYQMVENALNEFPLFVNWKNSITKHSILNLVRGFNGLGSDNMSLFRYMSNVREHMIHKAYAKKVPFGVDDIDIWLSGTFPMALISGFEILSEYRVLDIFLRD